MNAPRTSNPARLYLLADVLSVIAAYYTTLFIRFSNPWGEQLFTWINRTLGVRETGAVDDLFRAFYVDSAPRIISLLILVLCGLYTLRDLYADRLFLRRRSAVWTILVCNVIALVIFYTYFYLQRNVFHPRSMFVSMLFLNVGFASTLRAWLDRLLRTLRIRHGIDRWPVIVIGRNRDADRILEIIASSPEHDMALAEQLDATPGESFASLLARTRASVTRHHAQIMILADARCPLNQIMQFLELADELGIAAKILSRELDILLTRARIEGDLIHGTPLVHFAAPSSSHLYERLKRIVSSVLAALAVLALAPVMALVALAIRLSGPGPVFFMQERIGVNRKPFRMFKFRTMIHGADEQRADLESHNQSGAALFKMRNDPRITRIGRFLRRYSIDELPQLLNIVRGDMTLVGPRPLPQRDFANYYEDWHYGRHHGLPGLTCLWQVSGRSELDFSSMCILDVYYLRNQSPVLDLKILWRTIWVVLFARGAY